VNLKALISHKSGDSKYSSKGATDTFQVSQASPGGTEPPRRSDLIDGEEKRPSVSSHERGGETCDVCGYVNQEHASVCLQCDVPLPSSLTPLRMNRS
jgi:hypothetical protein